MWLELTCFKFNRYKERIIEHLWHSSSKLNKRDRVKVIKSLMSKKQALADELKIKVRMACEPRVFNTKNFLNKCGYYLHEKVYIKVVE